MHSHFQPLHCEGEEKLFSGWLNSWVPTRGFCFSTWDGPRQPASSTSPEDDTARHQYRVLWVSPIFSPKPCSALPTPCPSELNTAGCIMEFPCPVASSGAHQRGAVTDWKEEGLRGGDCSQLSLQNATLGFCFPPCSPGSFSWLSP